MPMRKAPRMSFGKHALEVWRVGRGEQDDHVHPGGYEGGVMYEKIR